MSSTLTKDGHHLLLSYQIERGQRRGRNVFVPIHWRIYDLSAMLVSVKYEFNASNRGMYRQEALLAEGDI